MRAAIFVLAYYVGDDLSFSDTLVFYEATPDQYLAIDRAYEAGHQSGLLERVKKEYPNAKFVNDYAILLTLGSQE